MDSDRSFAANYTNASYVGRSVLSLHVHNIDSFNCGLGDEGGQRNFTSVHGVLTQTP